MVILTELAAKEVKQIIDQQQSSAKKNGDATQSMFLRVGVKGGGCSGFSYTLDLTESKGENDEEWDQFGIPVICDSKSMLYLDGATVDFKDELMGRGFVFRNPNASSSCGCGSSFSA
ncbi:MAG: iron-sulfur cluster assembly accessory protein [Planctomycetes bacterium]|nr:iron-sulfur cluster assembly accessory protein [Planctomycetota bacterium]MBI3836202.1 iron-sulfur cluster assembly accessory protein [Planctomycetota bacterium]